MTITAGILLKSLRLRHYKCFLDSKEIAFEPGINVIAGANSAGKSTLLEAAALVTGRFPHKSEKTIPRYGGIAAGETRVDITLQFGREVVDAIVRQSPAFPIESQGHAHRQAEMEQYFHGMREQTRSYRVSLNPDGWEHHPGSHTHAWAMTQWTSDGVLVLSGATTSGAEVFGQSFGALLAKHYRACVYRFDAQRFRTGTCRAGASALLKSDASNLPEVLNQLQANTVAFEKYNDVVRRVLPIVTRVSVRTNVSDLLQVLIWKGSPRSDRIDLATPLDECGTGIAQILAILYVITQGDGISTIIIDEPNSFLHPGAVASLIEILHEHTEHQYIIATHSPGVISAARPAMLHLLHADGCETRVRAITHSQRDDQRAVLDSVGARLEDVFGPDHVLWVEGPSEAKVFPQVAQALKLPIARLAFLPLVNVGDLQAKHATLAAQIYQNMAKGIALIPPACAFVLDAERRSLEDLEKIRSAAPGRLFFLKRAMLENYLLHEGAISHLLSRLNEPVDPAKVADWSRGYLKSILAPEDALQRDDLLAKFDGARMLGRAVTELTETRHSFDKVAHDPILAEWVLANKAETLQGILDVLREALSGISTERSQ